MEARRAQPTQGERPATATRQARHAPPGSGGKVSLQRRGGGCEGRDRAQRSKRHQGAAARSRTKDAEAGASDGTALSSESSNRKRQKGAAQETRTRGPATGPRPARQAPTDSGSKEPHERRKARGECPGGDRAKRRKRHQEAAPRSRTTDVYGRGERRRSVEGGGRPTKGR